MAVELLILQTDMPSRMEWTEGWGASVVGLLAQNLPSALDSILMSWNVGYNSPRKEAAWSSLPTAQRRYTLCSGFV